MLRYLYCVLINTFNKTTPMASEPSHGGGVDLKVIRKLLKKDIRARRALLTLPLTELEKLEHWNRITDANWMRHDLRVSPGDIPLAL